MALFRELKGIFNTKISIENAIIAIQELYEKTKRGNPGEDPHMILLKTAFSRLSTENTIKRLGRSEADLVAFAGWVAALPSCLPDGLNVRLLAMRLVSEERPDVWAMHPEFQVTMQALVDYLTSEATKHGSLLEMYAEHNGGGQAEHLAPDAYAILVAISEGITPDEDY